MQEVYLLNRGDTMSKVSCEYPSSTITSGTGLIRSKKYMVINGGSDDIRIVRNYLPLHLHRVKKGENKIDILSRGYDIIGGNCKRRRRYVD